MSDSGDPKLDRQRELEAEREHYEATDLPDEHNGSQRASPVLHSSEWLEPILTKVAWQQSDVAACIRGCATYGAHKDHYVAEAIEAILKKLQAALVEARRELLQDVWLCDECKPILKQRLARLDTTRKQTGGDDE